jgi:polysaccharide biosynthesis protein PelA
MIRALVFALLLALLGSAFAQAQAQPVPRRVLVLWDSTSVAKDWRNSFAHSMLEMPLNRLGYIAEPLDVAKKLPDPAGFADAHAVVAWIDTDSVPDPADMLAFLERATRAGLRFVLIGEPGFLRARSGGEGVSLAAANAVFERAGFRLLDEYVRLTFDVEADPRVPALVEYERALEPPLAPFAVWRPSDTGTISALVLRKRDRPETESHVVMVGKQGGLAALGYSHFYEPELRRRQWRIDPIVFLARTLGANDAPIPDVTTLVGRRIYFSHIDGDGWRNVTEIQPGRRLRKLSAEIVLDEAIAPFPDLPVTMAPIVADLHSEWCGTQEGRAIARRIFALPQVEAGSHTWTHPFDWPFFERPDAEALERAVASRYPGCQENAGWIAKMVARVRNRVSGNTEAKKRAAEFDGQYGAAGAYNTPRAYAGKPYALTDEIGGAAAYIQTLLPPGKTLGLVQWSGNTAPGEAALALATQAGLRNINGGDTRFDAEFNSLSYVAPIGRRVGAHWQIYAAASNENTYTDLWSDRYFGFRDLAETIANTGAPRRLTPVNVYYHVYSGEKDAALQALLGNLAYARGLEIAPIFASHYAAIAEGFYRARIIALGDRAWRIEDRGALQTVRFDPPFDGAAVDFARARGVLGFRRDAGALYVALDPAEAAPVVALGRAGPANTVYLIDSRWPIADLKRGQGTFEFAAEGFGAGTMHWRVASDAQYALAVDGTEMGEVRADAHGTLALSLPRADGRRVAVRLRRVQS